MLVPQSLPLRTQCWLAVVQAYQACQRQYARLLQAHQLTIAQFDLLGVVADGAGLATPAQVAERLMVTRGNVSPLLRRVLRRGWVSEKPHPQDRRSLLLSLTPAGAALLRRARAASACFIQVQLAPFDDEQLRQTLEQMQQMRAHLEAMDVDAVLARAEKAISNKTSAAS